LSWQINAAQNSFDGPRVPQQDGSHSRRRPTALDDLVQASASMPLKVLAVFQRQGNRLGGRLTVEDATDHVVGNGRHWVVQGLR
jgi:hypothetical protein